jgi:hypothetical protein
MPAYIFIISSRVCVRLSGLPLSHQQSYPILSSTLNIFSDDVFLLLLKTALFGLKQVLSNFYAISFLWHRCNFREKETFHQAQSRKCRARYCDVAKTTSSIRQSNYLPLLLYRIPLINHSWLILFKYFQLNMTFKYTGNLWSTNSDLASHRVLKSWRLIDNFKASNGFPSRHGGKNRYHLEPWYSTLMNNCNKSNCW